MKNIYMKMYKKTIYLLIITVLPIGIYLFNNEGAQTTFRNSIIDDLDRYIIEGHLDEENQCMIFSQEISFTNTSMSSMDKLYLDINPKTIKVESISINDKNSSYKIIGPDNNKIIVFPAQPIESKSGVIVSIKYILTLKTYKSQSNDNVYRLEKWYPQIPNIDENGWRFSDGKKEYIQSYKKQYSIKIVMPVNYIIDTGMKIPMTRKMSNKFTTNHIQGISDRSVTVLVIRR